MDTLQISAIQAHLLWENPVANRSFFEKQLKQLPKNTDLVILPETFTTGFTMHTSLAEPQEGATQKWMQHMALTYNTAIAGSYIVEDKGILYNRFVFIAPDKTQYTYDKRHTFSLAGESKVYAKGKEQVVFNYKGWAIAPFICYDLRFPVWSRNTPKNAYDLAIYVANWPEKRILAWDTLLKARAIENQAYVLGVNRVGIDGSGYAYNGHSGLYDALGEQLLFSEKQELLQYTLCKQTLAKQRQRFAFLQDQDAFTLG